MDLFFQRSDNSKEKADDSRTTGLHPGGGLLRKTSKVAGRVCAPCAFMAPEHSGLQAAVSEARLKIQRSCDIKMIGGLNFWIRSVYCWCLLFSVWMSAAKDENIYVCVCARAYVYKTNPPLFLLFHSNGWRWEKLFSDIMSYSVMWLSRSLHRLYRYKETPCLKEGSWFWYTW